MSRKCACGNLMNPNGHIACPRCWALVPSDLQKKIYRLNRESKGSEAHLIAIREALTTVIEMREKRKTSENLY